MCTKYDNKKSSLEYVKVMVKIITTKLEPLIVISI